MNLIVNLNENMPAAVAEVNVLLVSFVYDMYSTRAHRTLGTSV